MQLPMQYQDTGAMFTEFEFTPWLLGGAVVLSLAAGVRILSGPHEAPSAPALPSKEGFGAQVYDSFATFLNWPTASTSWFNWGLWGSDSTEYADAAQRLVLALLRSIDAEPSVVIGKSCTMGYCFPPEVLCTLPDEHPPTLQTLGVELGTSWQCTGAHTQRQCLLA